MPLLQARVALVHGLAIVLLAACSKDSTAPIKPASINGTSSGFTATVGTALSASPTFTILDASGSAMANVAVTITVAGGGSLAGAATKSGSGATSVGTWTLGNIAGTNTLSIAVSGLTTPLVISATGTPDVASQITVNSGGTQSAFASAALASAVVFKVGDKFNNGIAGQTVTFAIVAGGGAFGAGATTAMTDANGLVSAPAWTLGKSTVAQQMKATWGSVTATATATVTSAYNIDVRFWGPAMDPSVQAVFLAAAARIQGFIVGDVVNIPASPPADPRPVTGGVCASAVPISGIAPVNEAIDDIIIFATVGPIDGPRNIIGSSGPCYARGTSGNGPPLIAFMTFDVADIQMMIDANQLSDVILHEMLHALGFGIQWAGNGLVSGGATATSAFIGQQAVAGCLFHGGAAANQCGQNTVPLETTGGFGTRDVHWRESTSATGIGFRTELMTGFISPAGVANPLSRITIGSMADLGYTVNLLSADTYTVPSTIAASLSVIRESQGMGEFTLNELVYQPAFGVEPSGRVRPFPRRK